MLSLWYLANGNREINNNISPLICISVPCLRILANDVIMRRVIISLSVTTVHNYNNIVIHEETALAMTFSTLIIQFQADDTELVLFTTILFSAIAIHCCLCTIQIWLSCPVPQSSYHVLEQEIITTGLHRYRGHSPRNSAWTTHMDWVNILVW